ncbi:hypothetical protein AWB64_04813 [Caballeronia sordidicola]|uniref:Uncharacterized protein n=1 Tax=Caballeronia sordidicola TaxID=196367 RepID=A0A158HM14_CABSO|nr:hypothetical protein AWB64_04813 [Caballeronia sordidicola]
MLRRLSAAIYHLLKHAPHTVKVTNLALYIIQVGTRHTVGIRARLLRVMREREQFANLIYGKAKFPASPDEGKAFKGSVVVLSIAVACPTGSRQKVDLFVVADRFDIDR